MLTAYSCQIKDDIEFSCDYEKNQSATVTIYKSELRSILNAWKQVKGNNSGLTLQVKWQGDLIDLNIPNIVMERLVHISALAVLRNTDGL